MVTALIIGRPGAARDEHAGQIACEGCAVLSADSTTEGIDRVERSCPDLVVLEAELPGVEEHEALARLTTRVPRIPVLLVALAPDERAREAADACVLRGSPGANEALRHAVRRLLDPHAA
jgi:CheY-like chemotaxis protein